MFRKVFVTLIFILLHACNSSTQGGDKTSVVVKKTPAKPKPPTHVSAVAGVATVSLTWDAVEGATHYNVLSSGQAGGPYKELSDASAPKFNHEGLPSGNPYFYVVQAVNENGVSANSAEVSATPLALVVPPSPPIGPTGLSAVAAGVSQIDLTWNDNSSDESGFKVERKTGSGGSYSVVATLPAGTESYNDTGLAIGTQYFFRVYAYNGNGNSLNSNVADATTLVNVTAPTLSANAAQDGYATLSWNAQAAALSYNLYWSTVSGVTKTNGAKLTGITSPFIHGGLTNGITYHYVVTAVFTPGESVESNEISVTPANGAGAADTLFAEQWHLNNSGQQGATGVSGFAGEDINVVPAWVICGTGNTCRGEGVRVAVVDDGLEIRHEDLFANVASAQGHDYVHGDADPTNDNSDSESGHGTMVGGIIAARDLNGTGVRGVAPRAQLAGYNLLLESTNSNEADAMTRNGAAVAVSNNSWGAADGEGTLAPANMSWQTAINTGLAAGRGGLGIVYAWAAGNGGDSNDVDNSNYDGQANNRGVMAVGAVNDRGVKSSYSERGANLWVSAPGGEYCDTHTITTVDRSGNLGINNQSTAGIDDYIDKDYTQCMNGTSSATPIVAGVAALVIQANPALGWRDVRFILAATARKNDSTDLEWAVNGAGFNIHPNYGFGVVDANAAVAYAKTWSPNLPVEKTFTTSLSSPNLAIPDNNATGVSSDIAVSGSGISEIEFVEITFSAANHTYSGDLEITFVSPDGTESLLAETHGCLDSLCSDYDGWVFGSANQLGETANGTWTLKVRDLGGSDTGTFQSWKIKLYGI